MFNPTHIDLGEIRAGIEVKIEFPYTDIQVIKSTEVSCDCTSVIIDGNRKVLIAVYKPNSISQHLAAQGETRQRITKVVKLVYDDTFGLQNIAETLSFSATVIG